MSADTRAFIFADLHTHSTQSDGIYTPEQIVDMAVKAKLGALAVTDHDTLVGSRRAREYAAQTDLLLVPGVEISTKTDGRDVHLLGYFIDLDDPSIDAFFVDARERRVKRALAIADNLHEAGYPVSSDDMRKRGGTLNRTLLARILVDEGVVETVDEAFAGLISKESPYFVDDGKTPSPKDAIELILKGGGCPFIAHAHNYHVADLIPELASSGMVGVEANYTLHTQEQRDDLKRIAAEYGLGVSGGSDWHGDATHGASLGGAGLSKSEFADFLHACEKDWSFFS